MTGESNYEKMKYRAARLFLQYDQETMIRRFGLSHDREFLYIDFFSKRFRINRKTGLAEYQEDRWTEADFNAAMTIYDLLGYAKEERRLAGEFASVGNLNGMERVASQPGNKELYGKEARLFDSHSELLRQACRTLGGTEEGKGDIAYRIPVFSFMDMRLEFWKSDEEFPAQISLLWDKNILMYLHYETVWYAAGYLLGLLTKMILQEETRGRRED